jgi:AcrR family transcriptional regulator
MKSDPRVRYTQSVIENALISLLKTKPLEKITVKEICEMAMINRSTFYKHYQDCYDLAERLKQRAMHDFMETLQGMKEGEATEMITALLEKMRENSDLFHTLGRHEGEQIFINTLAVSCFAYMNEQIDVLKKMDLDESGKKMVSSYVTGGSAALIEYWLRTGCTQPAREIAAMMISMSNALMQNLPEFI